MTLDAQPGKKATSVRCPLTRLRCRGLSGAANVNGFHVGAWGSVNDDAERPDRAEERRHRELGQFLRKARERITPTEVGIDVSGRRRTPGLRREEVAALAGVSPVWYTWLEQGRDVQASPHVLSALASALRLSNPERDYIFRVGRGARTDVLEPPEVAPSLALLLHAMPVPVIILNHRLDILGHNDYADALYQLNSLPPEESNVIRMTFGPPGRRALFHNWTDLARTMVGMVRVSYAMHPDDPGLLKMIEDMRVESAEFARWWDEQFVNVHQGIVVKMCHPVVGDMSFDIISLRTFDELEITVGIYIPIDEKTNIAVRELCGVPRDPSDVPRASRDEPASHRPSSRPTPLAAEVDP
ncbi:MAG: helix-turn-helix domain-containing protein [Kutzneria sp.]|nr:helix-turn-helix domain-containing protein [Kutzneria sp.]